MRKKKKLVWSQPAARNSFFWTFHCTYELHRRKSKHHKGTTIQQHKRVNEGHFQKWSQWPSSYRNGYPPIKSAVARHSTSCAGINAYVMQRSHTPISWCQHKSNDTMVPTYSSANLAGFRDGRDYGEARVSRTLFGQLGCQVGGKEGGTRTRSQCDWFVS